MRKTNPSRTSLVSGRVDARRKARVERIFGQLGLSPDAAIELFYAQVEQHRGLPFDVVLGTDRQPSAETLASLGEDVGTTPSLTFDELMRSIRREAAS